MLMMSPQTLLGLALNDPSSLTRKNLTFYWKGIPVDMKSGMAYGETKLT